jgi:ribosomal protein L37AE/L43A
MSEHPVERFDSLLRDLLAWHLVEESPTEGWALRPDVAQRLQSLARLSRREDPSDVVYFSHTCSGCHSRGLTRLRDGHYLCDACQRAAELAAVATPLPPPEQGRPRRGVRDRVRKIAS